MRWLTCECGHHMDDHGAFHSWCRIKMTRDCYCEKFIAEPEFEQLVLV